MAQGDVTVSNKGKAWIGTGNWGSATIKVMLVTGTPNLDTTDFIDDISSTEITAANYTAGGVEITDSAPSVDTTNDRALYDAGDAAWTSLGTPSGTIAYGVIYEDTGTPSTSAVIAWVALTTQPNGGNYTIAWSSSPACVFYVG